MFSLKHLMIVCSSIFLYIGLSIGAALDQDTSDGVCEHDGKVYSWGDTIPHSDPCAKCICHRRGVACMTAMCAPIQCVDHEKIIDTCCGECPNGPNCKVGGKIIPLGETIEEELDEHCNRTCYCDHGLWFRKGMRPMCDIHCDYPPLPPLGEDAGEDIGGLGGPEGEGEEFDPVLEAREALGEEPLDMTDRRMETDPSWP